MKLYRTRTQAEYDFLMQELEDEGFFWGMSKLNPTATNNFNVYGDRTIIRVNTDDDTLAYGIDSLFHDTPIILALVFFLLAVRVDSRLSNRLISFLLLCIFALTTSQLLNHLLVIQLLRLVYSFQS